MATQTVPDVSSRDYWEQREREERWAEGEIRRAEADLSRGHRAGAFNCEVCGRFKSRPSERCDHCGDDPVTHNGDPLELDRAHGYFTMSTVRRPSVARKRSHKPIGSGPVHEALVARAKADEDLKRALRQVPHGRERWQAIRACLAAGMKRAEIARLMDVSPQRVSQMLAEDDCPF